jgi:hypothetical protein
MKAKRRRYVDSRTRMWRCTEAWDVAWVKRARKAERWVGFVREEGREEGNRAVRVCRNHEE